jgi:iron-sulfur cluster repair protein YtfE (RIC family)
MKRQTGTGGCADPANSGQGHLSSGLDRAHEGLGRALRALDKKIEGGAARSEILDAFGLLARTLATHFRFEEEELFPNLLLVTGNQARAAIDVLLQEHVELMRRLELLSQAINSGRDLKEAFEAFRKLMSSHQAREMSLVYPLSNILLPPSVRHLLSQHIAETENPKKRSSSSS